MLNSGATTVLLDFNKTVWSLFLKEEPVGSKKFVGDILKFGAFESLINGEANVSLAGATHTGKTLGVH